jgi:hypothetical protein
MKRCIRVRGLIQREGLCGKIVQLFHSRRTGMIHGYDGYDVTFNEESLVVGLNYREFSLDLKVSYGIFFATGAKIPTAINVMPASGEQSETTDEEKQAASTRAGGLGIVWRRELSGMEKKPLDLWQTETGLSYFWDEGELEA